MGTVVIIKDRFRVRVDSYHNHTLEKYITEEDLDDRTLLTGWKSMHKYFTSVDSAIKWILIDLAEGEDFDSLTEYVDAQKALYELAKVSLDV